MLSRKGAAEFLDVPEGTVANWAYTGKGPKFYRVGKHTRYKISDILEWLEENAREPRVSS
jgi:excisionase family DNA binding protein